MGEILIDTGHQLREDRMTVPTHTTDETGTEEGTQLTATTHTELQSIEIPMTAETVTIKTRINGIRFLAQMDAGTPRMILGALARVSQSNFVIPNYRLSRKEDTRQSPPVERKKDS